MARGSMDALLTLLAVVVTAAINGAVTVAVLRTELRHLRREVTRAHLRLDRVAAPNVTVAE